MATGSAQSCGNCSHISSANAKFCEECGWPLAGDAVPAHDPQGGHSDPPWEEPGNLGAAAALQAEPPTTPVTSAPVEAPTDQPAAGPGDADADGQDARGHHRGRWIAVGTTLVVLLAVVAGGAYFMTRGPSAVEIAVDAADSATVSTAQALQTAQTTADVRAASEAAVAASTAAADALSANPGDGTAEQALGNQAELLAAFASLAELNADNLASWADTQAQLEQSIEALSSLPEGTPGTSAASEARLATARLDDLVSAAQETLAQWQAAVAEAQAASEANAAAVASLDAYAAAVQSVLQRYAGERQETAAFTERVRTEGATYAEGYREMSAGASSRRALRSELTAMSVPDGLSDQHNRLVAMISSAAEAMDAGYAGLEDSDYCYTDCYYEDTPGWQQFQSESDRVTGEFGSAEEAWQQQVDAVRASLGAVGAPPQPEV